MYEVENANSFFDVSTNVLTILKIAKISKFKKKDCLAKLLMKRLFMRPHIAEIVYYHIDHTRETGSATYDPNDHDSIGKKSLDR